MAVNTQAVGKRYEPTRYAVGREKVIEYALAVGERKPLHHDVDAARAAGNADVVAPPMFAVVFAARSMAPALFDPEVGINFALMVHGGQELSWGELVVAGDEIMTEVTVKEIYEQEGRGFYIYESISRNQRGAEVVRGTWTHIVRGA